jgi:aminoglycoside phosphotransferase family enzyme/predicted kinase
MKRAVRFSFLDFRTLADRERALRAELRLNLRTAPTLYERVLPVTREAAGTLALEGKGQPVEWLLQMRRFPSDALYENIAERGGLTAEEIDRLAEAVVAFYAIAEPRPDKGGFLGMREVVEGNAEDLSRLAGEALSPEAVAEVDRLSRALLERHAPLLEARRRDGLVRHCHGDLHLRNIVRLDGRPVLFDCIEFNDDFACIDVLYDLAFLVMDLEDRGLGPLAQRLLQGYVERTGEAEGLALLPLFLGARAAIRAKVEGFAAGVQAEPAERERRRALARGYLALALRALKPPPPRLVAIGGRSGTGKSSLAAALAPALGAMPGAVVLRSDVLRKRLFGRQPSERLPAEAYAPEVSARVFAEIERGAARILAAGHAVIADAVYGQPSQRAGIAAVAEAAGAPFCGIWLCAPEAELERRVEARRGDASDADAAVVRLQRALDETGVTWLRLRADRPLAAILADAQKCLEP